MIEKSLEICGCCDGLKAQTPQEIYNRPGLCSIKYRSGTHAHFKESLLAALSDIELFQGRDLEVIRDLKTRDDDDFTIALLDAWATVSDVLTFYQERIANECYLRTATEKESLFQIARLIGYKPCPGIAASTHLAFFMETAEGAPKSTSIESGMKVQSIPGPGETPVIFETVESIEARPIHNELKPRLTQEHPLKRDQNPFYFQGIATGLRPGDGIFVYPGEDIEPHESYFCLVSMVNPVPQENKTEVWMQPPFEMRTDQGKQIKKAAADPASPDKANSAGRYASSSSSSESHVSYSQKNQDIYKGVYVISANYNALAIMKGTTSERLFADHAFVAEKSRSKRRKKRPIDFYYAESPPNEPLTDQSLPENPPPMERLPAKDLPIGVIAFRIRANIFGYNAPSFASLPNSLAVGTLGYKRDISKPDDSRAVIRSFAEGPYLGRENTWVDTKGEDSWVGTNLSDYCFYMNGQRDCIFLDSAYDIAEGALVLLKDKKSNCKIFRAKDVISESKSDFTLASKITTIKLQLFEDGDSSEDVLKQFTVRGTTVFSGGEILFLSDVPYTDSVTSNGIELDKHVDGLREGQTVIICGQLDTDKKRGVLECECVTISSIRHLDQPGGFTQIFLKEGLKNSYIMDTVKIYANIALATAGETKEEVLGSGDSSKAFQRFNLLNSPLTYVSAQNSQGAVSTLKVDVDGVQWQEVLSLFDKGPNDRIYTIQIDPEGKTTVIFGDGRNGARLPTGQENVRAVYRKSLGSEGNVAADKISLLMSMPLGLRSARNPQAANGGSDPEDLEDSRINIPLGVITMDRLVSLKDYEDFARAFAGIGKALATWTWNGQVRGVFVTVAGPLGETVEVDSQVYKNLLGEMQRQGDPFVPVDLRSYSKAFFRTAASVKIDPAYKTEEVLSWVRNRVVSSFSFKRRKFGQQVALSEVIGLIKSVPGVAEVDVSKLYRVSETPGKDLNPRLLASMPVSGQEASKVAGAELLTIDPLQPFDFLGVMF